MSVLVGQLARKGSFPRVLWEAQIAEHFFPMDVSLEVDDPAVAPPAQMSGRRGHAGTALLPTPSEHMECDRVFAKIEEDLRLKAKFPSEDVLKISMPPPDAVVTVVDAAAGHRDGRVEFDRRIAAGDERLHVPRIERFVRATVEINVLLRHRPRSIPQAQESA